MEDSKNVDLLFDVFRPRGARLSPANSLLRLWVENFWVSTQNVQQTRGVSPSGIAIGGQVVFKVPTKVDAAINASPCDGILYDEDKNYMQVLLYGVISGTPTLLFMGDVCRQVCAVVQRSSQTQV